MTGMSIIVISFMNIYVAPQRIMPGIGRFAGLGGNKEPEASLPNA